MLWAGLEATRELGAEVMVYESGWIQEWPAGGLTNMHDFMVRERELLREVGEECLPWKGKIAIETMAGAEYMRSYTDWPQQLVDQITLTNHRAVGVCIDTGHSYIAASRLGYDFLDGVRQACAICIHIPFARQFRYSGFAPPGGGGAAVLDA